MKKSLISMLAMFMGSLGWAGVLNCTGYPPRISLLPMNTTWAYSPTVVTAVLTDPAIGNAIVGGAAAWNFTDANGRLAGWNGNVGLNDCPSRLDPAGKRFQITALPFDIAHLSCPVAAKYQTNDNGPGGAYVKRGLADMYLGSDCPTCGSESVIVNLNLPYSVDGTPAANEYDLQSLIAHELGHVLGFGHYDYGSPCNIPIYWYHSMTCATSPRINIMSNWIFSGETCQRHLTSDDLSNANSIY